MLFPFQPSFQNQRGLFGRGVLRVRGRNAAERSRRTEDEGQGGVPVIEQPSAAALDFKSISSNLFR